ncbi:MAG: alpha/beta hydrolase [Bacteroidales bacterium]
MKIYTECGPAGRTPVAYQVKGSGLPLVFLHGYLESSEIWKEFTPGFTNRCRVFTIDLPGHGLTAPAGEASTMELMAGAVLAVLDHHGIDRALVVGHSMGGYTALAILEHHPERMLGLALLHSHPFADTEAVVEKRRREMDIVAKGYKHLLVSQNIPNMFAEETLPLFARELRMTRRIAGHTSAEGIIAAIRGLMARPDRSRVLAETRVPCLNIIGKHDKYIDFTQVSLRTELPAGSERLVLEHAGHMGFFEEKARVYQGLQDFIRRL